MSNIPDFDHNNVIPPYIGSPTRINCSSPYKCNILEMCQRFANTTTRVELLESLIMFRLKISQLMIPIGFQWIDGSFVEDIETLENRDPNDIDVVSFIGYDKHTNVKDLKTQISQNFPEFLDSQLSKRSFSIDHYVVELNTHPLNLVDNVKYWIQLFTHNRNQVWKGIIQIDLNTDSLDQQALVFLQNRRL